MKKLSLLIFGWLLTISVFGQLGFRKEVSIPVSNGVNALTMPWAGGLDYPLFSQMDLNADGIQDLVVIDRHNNRLSTYLNNGSTGTTGWIYAPQYERFFPAVSGWAFLYDYNCDGKPDFFTTTFRNNGIMQYRNDTQGGNIVFTLVDTAMLVQSPFGAYNIFASSYLVPNLNDIDGDGDMDVIGQQFNCVGAFAYYKNRSMEDYGVCDSLNDFELVTNAWGKFALRTGSFPQVAVSAYNISCQVMSPLDDQSQAARRDDTFANIFTIDIDNDGDQDALIGDSQTDNTLLVINGGTPGNAMMVSQDTLFPSYDIPVRIKSFSAPSYVDADNDGVKDFIVSQSEYRNFNGVHLYKNNGSTALPNFHLQQTDFLENEMIDVGEGASPVFFDYDGDGLKDLVIGNKRKSITDSTGTTGLTLYRNNGTASAPSFVFVTDNYLNLNAQNYSGTIYPAFGDLDQDGDDDLILGLDNGTMVYFRNCAGAGTPPNFCMVTPNYMSIDIGNAASPQIIDLKRDGKADLVVGEKNGVLNYFENIGTIGSPFFAVQPSIDTLGQINLQTINATDGYTVPFIFDYNGSYRLVVSCMKGDVYLYGNIDNNISGAWVVMDTIISLTSGSRYGYNLSVSGDDINNDSLTDLLVGLYTGGVQIYLQNDTTTGIQSLPKDKGFKVYPNPSSEYFVIKSEKGEGTYVLYDRIGQAVGSGLIAGGYAIVSVQSFASGIYFLSVNRSAYEKIVISR